MAQTANVSLPLSLLFSQPLAAWIGFYRNVLELEVYCSLKLAISLIRRRDWRNTQAFFYWKQLEQVEHEKRLKGCKVKESLCFSVEENCLWLLLIFIVIRTSVKWDSSESGSLIFNYEGSTWKTLPAAQKAHSPPNDNCFRFLVLSSFPLWDIYGKKMCAKTSSVSFSLNVDSIAVNVKA